jgi:ribosomal protein S6
MPQILHITSLQCEFLFPTYENEKSAEHEAQYRFNDDVMRYVAMKSWSVIVVPVAELQELFHNRQSC